MDVDIKQELPEYEDFEENLYPMGNVSNAHTCCGFISLCFPYTSNTNTSPNVATLNRTRLRSCHPALTPLCDLTMTVYF